MGDAPMAYVEGAGGTRVAEDQIVAVGKNDVSEVMVFYPCLDLLISSQILSFKVGR
jgi:hypothetical protein